MSVGFVVPCFNEGRRWNSHYWDDLFALDRVSWLLVDDGSSDGSHEILGNHTQKNVKVHRLERNVGKGEAVRRGLGLLLERDLSWVGFIDADGAFEVDEIVRFLDLARSSVEETKAVWSSRVRMRGRTIERSPSRHAVGRTIATALSIRYPNLPYDSQSGLKLFRSADELTSSIRDPFATRWLFDVELYTRLDRLYGQHSQWLWEEPLNSWHHVTGSKISSRETIRIPFEIARLLSSGVVRRANRR